MREKIEARIARRGGDVFLTREFRDLGDERQVLRALRELMREGKLIRLGYGAYGRAEISPITQQPMLARRRLRRGVAPGARQAQVRWEPTGPSAPTMRAAAPRCR